VQTLPDTALGCRFGEFRQTSVCPARIVFDLLEHMFNQLSPQISFAKLLLKASECQSNHVRGRDGDPFKLSLCSDPPDPLMLLGGQRCGDLVVGLRSARHHASSLTSGHLDGKSSGRSTEQPLGSERAFRGYGPRMTIEEWAAGEAEHLLSTLGDRWKHVRAVAERARSVAAILDREDRHYLVAAAYLHDIGYAPDLQRTGLHQLDGARHLRSLGAERLARLVAHHSEARFEIQLRGFGEELTSYKREESWVSDALTYCDLTTGPTGLPMTFEDRVAEVEQRYGDGEIVEALRQATPYLVAAIKRTKDRLRTTQVADSIRR
jgi:hypothetical protein